MENKFFVSSVFEFLPLPQCKFVDGRRLLYLKHKNHMSTADHNKSVRNSIKKQNVLKCVKDTSDGSTNVPLASPKPAYNFEAIRNKKIRDKCIRRYKNLKIKEYTEKRFTMYSRISTSKYTAYYKKEGDYFNIYSSVNSEYKNKNDVTYKKSNKVSRSVVHAHNSGLLIKYGKERKSETTLPKLRIAKVQIILPKITTISSKECSTTLTN